MKLLAYFPYVDHWKYRQIVNGILREVKATPAAEVLLFMFWSQHFEKRLYKKEFDGIITGEDYSLPVSSSSTLPVVSVRHTGNPENYLHVLADPDSIALRVVNHFQAQDIQHIGLFHSMDPKDEMGRIRSERVKLRCRKRNLPVHVFAPRPSTPITWNLEDQLDELIPWLHSLPKPCGVFCGDDDHANRVLMAADQAGISVPSELAVLGYGNSDFLCENLNPTLSSVDPGWQAIGRAAVRRIVQETTGHSLKEPISWLDCSRVVPRASTDRRFHEFPIIQKAIKVVDEHMANCKSAQELASELNVSHTTLNTAFRQALGMSTWAYVKERKLDRALHLINSTELPLGDICLETGISTTSKLSTDIKRRTGASPRELRRMEPS